MNTAEEMALMKLVEASTPQQWRNAMHELAYGRGIRMSETARSVMREAASRMDAKSLRQMAPHPGDALARRVDPGPRPILSRDKLKEISEWTRHWRRREKLIAAGADLPGGLLLHGPTGTGKTTTTAWIATKLEGQMPTFVLDAHDWVRSHMGESAEGLARAFGALRGQIGALVLEEVDAVATRRGEGDSASREENRITIALMRLIESAQHPVIATTNRLDVLDPALLRRFETIIELPEPTDEIKLEIVSRLLGDAPLKPDLTKPIADLVKDARRARRSWALRDEDAADAAE